MKKFDVIILGAGASGLMVATLLKNKNIALIEANSEIGMKMKISGGGKCNITNKFLSEKNYLGDRVFIKSILEQFSNKELLTFLKKRGLTATIRDEKYYFCKNSSSEILNIFKNEIKNIPQFLNHKILSISKKDSFVIKTDRGNFLAKKVIVASGGVSYPKIGASDIGFNIAKSFGHKVNKLNPALVGFTVQKDEFWFKNLSGVSLIADIKVENKIFRDSLLFTHKGISGLGILSASLYWQKGQMTIDFLPKYSLDRILQNSKKQITTLLPLPKRFIKEFLKSINIEDKPIYKLTNDEKDKLKKLKNYSFAPAGNFGYSMAEVTKGGVSTDEINPNSMESKLIKGLYFIGEVVNVTGELGGYNFQWAFSSAFICSNLQN